MILIADGGSTKCDWLVAGRNGELVAKIRTEGMNPALLTKNQILDVLTLSPELTGMRSEIKQVHFYGAGCGLVKNQEHMKKAFGKYFTEAEVLEVREDLYAAVYACTQEPGVIAILGTGSNACYFDGEEITAAIPSLGYTLMDQGSGNHLGKAILRAYYFKQLPEHLSQAFEREYKTDPTYVKKRLYKKANPNAFLAGYTKFVLEQQHEPVIRELLKTSIREFAETHLIHYAAQLKTLPVHFVGSVAFFAQEVIREELEQRGWKVGEFVRRPIEPLFHYHVKKAGLIQEE